MSDSLPPPEPPHTGSPERPAPRRIRSLPVPLGGPSLLRASSTGYGEDANWRRGITVLWILFGLIAVGEIVSMAFHLLEGYTRWPGLFDVFRWCVFCGVFLALWSGWSWARWVLAIVAFLFGMSWLIQLFTETDRALGAGLSNGQRLPGESIQNAPLLATTGLYLILAGYLAFSGDVVGFAKHRREEGRAWVVAPVFLLLGLYLIIMLSGRGVAGTWILDQRQAADDFGQETLRALAANWDVAALDARCDEKLLASWPEAQRAATMTYLRPLGSIRDLQMPTVGVLSRFDGVQDRFVVRGSFRCHAEFTRGRATISLDLVRRLFGPWRLQSIGAENMHVAPTPAPAPAAPAATPAASPVLPTGG